MSERRLKSFSTQRPVAILMLFVAAAGNGGTDGWGDDNDRDPEFPASYSLNNILSVAATDWDDRRAYFSNFGQGTVHLAAPGTIIYSCTALNGPPPQLLFVTRTFTP